VKKGVDPVLFRVMKRNNKTGEVIDTGNRKWQRPPYGVKELARRRAAAKRAKASRKANRP
jgi:hypothetical protein